MPLVEYRDTCLPTNATGRDRAPSTPPNAKDPLMEPLLTSSTPGERYLVWAFSRDANALVALGFVRAEIGATYDTE